MVNVFAVPVFFVCFRESLETAIIVSVLLSFLKQSLPSSNEKALQQRLIRQVWWGIGLGMLIVVLIGAGLIGAFYGYGKNIFSSTEDLWEGIFGLIASIIITLMGAALLRVSKLQNKWKHKIAKAIETREHSMKGARFSQRFKLWCEKYAMFVLPFITVLREGLEAVVFIGGVGLGLPAAAFPLAVICGLLAGCLVGFVIYKGGNRAALQIFLIASTCFLYLVAAGLFSKAVWKFQQNQWNKITGGDAAETGSGPGSYNIHWTVWHVNCCNPEINGGGGWGVFNSILGWQNTGTYGSIISYNCYWIAVIVSFLVLGYEEKTGHWPFIKKTAKIVDKSGTSSPFGSSLDVSKEKEVGKLRQGSVRSIEA